MKTRYTAPIFAICTALVLTACGDDPVPADADESASALATTASTPEADETDTVGSDGESESPESEETATEEASTEEADDEFAEAFEERDQFLEDQQLPLDGSPLEATTPEQQDFIDSYRQDVEAAGGTWSTELETVTLGKTLDACETAILNFHEADEETVSMHILSSPLFDALIPADAAEQERELLEADLAATMVYGMSYICPDDHEQWAPIVQDMYPEHLGE